MSPDGIQALSVDAPPDQDLRVLCLGAHSDDIEIGCGGTLLNLLTGPHKVACTWVVFGASGDREREARESAAIYLGDGAEHTVRVEGFRDGYFPYVGGGIKDVFEELKQQCNPDVVFTHYREDRHQDHRVISDLTWNTYRRHLILEYEIPKYDGDLGIPNVFVPLTDAIRKQKISNLFRAFATQRDKGWFTEETFNSILRLRGIECSAADGYAEAFYGRKVVVGL